MKKIEEIFNILKDSGVIFYYENGIDKGGEVINLMVDDNGSIRLTLDYDKNYDISVYEFKYNHSRDNINYQDWSYIREFDIELDNLLEE